MHDKERTRVNLPSFNTVCLAWGVLLCCVDVVDQGDGVNDGNRDYWVNLFSYTAPLNEMVLSSNQEYIVR